MYDVICIGGGLNYVAAVVLAKSKLKVALIEKDLNHLGGTCLHEGCIPSKNLLHRTKVVFESKEEVFLENAKINLKLLQEKIKTHIQKTTKAIKNQCKFAGVELIEGKAFVVDKGKVEVNGKILEAKNIIIATGSRPRVPDGIEVDEEKIITSNGVFKLKEFPKEISIYGSGAIGLEMASFFAINGVKTNLIFRHSHISNKISPEIIERLQTQLKNIGVNLIPNYSITSAKVKNKVVINNEIKTDMLLVATGRVANTDVVKTDKIKVTKAIEVDEYFKTSLENVWAIGDCNAKLNLAHAARAQALNVANQILGKKEKLNLLNIPKFIYTIPLSYAVIGEMSEKFGEFELSHLGISSAIAGSELGISKIYVDNENFIKGAEFFAPNAEELIGIIATAITGEMDVELLKKVVFPHPTFSEEIDRSIRGIK
jgi:dihydrolipoamide dehydrogenase